jgi:uncharacterized membrane protein YedE/YeeE
MDRKRTAGLAIGIVFGVGLSWSGMTSPEVLRSGLLFEKSYLFLFFASAVLTSFIGLRLVRGRTALLTGERIRWNVERPQRRHIVGSLLFGIGWGVADACPGPIATQLGQGIAWGIPTTIGLVLGILLFGRLQARAQAERERGPAAAVIPSPVAADATA